ncbi:DUF1361 domain-containing protein [Myxococcus landrumensis]|uniref:DUF1361 domain-containing protein n=2 Tax=Myxococcus landrumensis TaxID=2813577 RepID=A0ABX7N3W7_9BACT|nr:DUF1361 domain-containing protein [Myxococcus landrumus]
MTAPLTMPSHMSFLSVLRRHGLWPAALSSAVGVGMVAYRLDWSQSASYAFLVWNLILAWAPYVIALAARVLMLRGHGLRVLAPMAMAWLALFPNAPYLLTDFIHVHQRPVVPIWFDVALMTLFVATGWLLGLLSLEVWKQWLEERWGRRTAWGFVGVTSVLCGYGIYLGRVERWNSWHVLTHPSTLFTSIGAHLREPLAFPYLTSLTVFFGLLVPLSYVAYEALVARIRRPRTAS